MSFQVLVIVQSICKVVQYFQWYNNYLKLSPQNSQWTVDLSSSIMFLGSNVPRSIAIDIQIARNSKGVLCQIIIQTPLKWHPMKLINKVAPPPWTTAQCSNSPDRKQYIGRNTMCRKYIHFLAIVQNNCYVFVRSRSAQFLWKTHWIHTRNILVHGLILQVRAWFP